MSQFAYVHNDNILLGLAVARKPCVSILSVAGSDIQECKYFWSWKIFFRLRQAGQIHALRAHDYHNIHNSSLCQFQNNGKDNWQ